MCIVCNLLTDAHHAMEESGYRVVADKIDQVMADFDEIIRGHFNEAKLIRMGNERDSDD